MAIWLLWVVIAAPAATIPLLQHQSIKLWQTQLRKYWLDPNKPPKGQPRMLLPIHDNDPLRRIREIERKQQGYLYGPSLLGNSSYFPTGRLGNALVQQHQEEWYSDAAWLTNTVDEEAVAAADALEKVGGLQKPSDYRFLYEGQWEDSVPSRSALGIFTNYTSDLLFSMERLSINPYAIKRLHPSIELPFTLDPVTSIKLARATLEALHRNGRLFVVDHSYQVKYPVSSGKHTAACTAYFYIHPLSGDFLPLAIKTNVGADLVYTPLDEENDWLLAKAMFNANDLFHGQIFHLANSHAVAEVVHQAALRTLSDSHPVLVLLNRLMCQAYAIRPVGETVLFNAGGLFDRSFAITNIGVRMFATEFYPTVAGPFQANYFLNDLVSRGLLNCTYGPALKSMPFFDDANVLYSSIRRFMVSFIEAYYTSENLLALDCELQSWVREATDKALVVDFPAAPLVHRAALVDILTHVAFLSGVSHHVLNSGEPVTTSGILPLHPSALYAPPPARKGVRDIMSFLPPAQQAVAHIALLARFNRPRLAAENRTLAYMFSSRELLDRGCAAVALAVARFCREMEAFSREIQRRKFDEHGLSQGMPFVWQALDPGQIPFFLSV